MTVTASVTAVAVTAGATIACRRLGDSVGVGLCDPAVTRRSIVPGPGLVRDTPPALKDGILRLLNYIKWVPRGEEL